MAGLKVAIEVEVRGSLQRRYFVFNVHFFLTFWITKEHENLAALATGTLHERSESLYTKSVVLSKRLLTGLV